MRGTILFYMMADFIWSLIPPGDDYKVALNDEGTDSVIKPQIMAATPACVGVRELYIRRCKRLMYMKIFLCLCDYSPACLGVDLLSEENAAHLHFLTIASFQPVIFT